MRSRQEILCNFGLFMSKFGCYGNSLGFLENLDSIFKIADPENPTMHAKIVSISCTEMKLNVRRIFLPVPVFHFWPLLTRPAARSHCNSWATCNFKSRSCEPFAFLLTQFSFLFIFRQDLSLHAKFEFSSFNRFPDTEGSQNSKSRSRDPFPPSST